MHGHASVTPFVSPTGTMAGIYLKSVGLDLEKDQLALVSIALSILSVAGNIMSKQLVKCFYTARKTVRSNRLSSTMPPGVYATQKKQTTMNPAFDVGFKSPTGTEKCGWGGASGNLCAAPSTRGRQCERHTCTIETCQRGNDSSALVCNKHSAENNIGKKKPKAKKIAEIAGGGSKKKSKKKGTTEIKGGSKKNATKSKDDRHAGGMPTGSKKKSKKKGAAEIKDGKKQGVKARSKKKEATATPESTESVSSCGWPKASGKDCAKATRAGRHCEKHTCTEEKCRRGKDGKAKVCKKHERTKEANVMQGEALVVALSDGEAAADLPEELYGGFEEALEADGDEKPDVGDGTGDLRMEALLEAADASGADGYLEVGGTSE